MNIANLIEGLKIFNDEFMKPQWNISNGGDSIIVWDDEIDDGGSIVSDEEKLNRLGWQYLPHLSGWVITSPI